MHTGGSRRRGCGPRFRQLLGTVSDASLKSSPRDCLILARRSSFWSSTSRMCIRCFRSYTSLLSWTTGVRGECNVEYSLYAITQPNAGIATFRRTRHILGNPGTPTPRRPYPPPRTSAPAGGVCPLCSCSPCFPSQRGTRPPPRTCPRPTTARCGPPATTTWRTRR